MPTNTYCVSYDEYINSFILKLDCFSKPLSKYMIFKRFLHGSNKKIIVEEKKKLLNLKWEQKIWGSSQNKTIS